jgi:hypothetical protein
MKILHAAGAALALSWAATASATVLTFDDLTDNTQWHSTAMPNGYGGLQWVGWNYYSWANAPYNPASGSTRLLHETLTPRSTPSLNAIFSDGPVTPFVFSGASFAGYSSDAYPKAVYFDLYSQGKLVHTSAQSRLSATSTFVDSGYSGLVDRVVVGGDVSYAALDNFSFAFVPGGYTPPVPEPETYLMMLAGLGLLGARRRR